MKVTLEPTTKFVFLDGIEHRVWEGETESGIPVFAFICRIAPRIENPSAEVCAEFDRDLRDVRAPTVALQAIPSRLTL